MKKLLSFLFILFLTGCGSSDNSSQVSVTPEKTPTYPDIKDSLFSQQWYLAKNDEFYEKYKIHPEAHIHFGDYLGKYTGKGVTVVVTDFGLDVNHTDLKGQIKETYNIDTNETDVGKTTKDYDDHGTMTTSLIAAKANDKFIYGIAHKSNAYFIKFSSFTDSAETIRMFKKADKFKADIINCSWGSDSIDDAIKEIIQNLAKNGRDGKGTLIVFASGNDNKTPDDESQIPEVIDVGASDARNTRSVFSNYSQNLDIVAPGGNSNAREYEQQDILALSRDNKKEFVAGTSFSAPIVSGVLALMLEANPNLTREQVEKILHETSDKIGRVPYDENGRNDYYGYGKINAKKAIEASLRLK